MTDCIILLSTAVSALATAVIACYAVKAHCLEKAIREVENQRQTEVKDLYQAIVIATLVGSGGASASIQQFKGHYKGKTQIF